jgi:hypothetical protein
MDDEDRGPPIDVPLDHIVMEPMRMQVGALTFSGTDMRQLFAAIAKTQASMLPVAKTGKNPQFKTEYSTLTDLYEAIRQPMAANNLAVLHGTTLDDDGNMRVTTMLGHAETGQWVSSDFVSRPSKIDPQGLGSATTYGRRYSLAAIIGACPDEDDDGNASSQPRQQRRDDDREERRPAPREVREEPRRQQREVRGEAPNISAAQAKAKALGAALKAIDADNIDVAREAWMAAWNDWLADAPRITREHFRDMVKARFGESPPIETEADKEAA